MKRSLTWLIVLMLAAGLCGLVLAAAWVTATLPAMVERTFGSPAATLSAIQRLALSIQLLSQQQELTEALNPNGPPQAFQIEFGESTHDITNRLQAAGLIKNAELLRTFLIYSGLDTTLQAGEYRLSASMTPVEIAQALQDAAPTEVTFNILAGWRLEEIAAALPTSGLAFSANMFLNFAHRPQPPPLTGLPPGATLEGFMFPASYQMRRDITLDGFVAAVVQNFQANVGSDLVAGFESHGLDLYGAVTLASIVEREAVHDAEMPQIASVFLNRLDAGMRLDSDPTVQYAIGHDPLKNTWWKNPLSLEDLQNASTYNTYQNAGLPPGPISNPGLEALRAVAFPAQTPYFYFRAACDGSGNHTFAETYAAHQSNACP